MKVFVTGVKGQLGYEVVRELTERGMETVGVDIDELDITDKTAVEDMIRAEAPDAVIHCAAWTAVDAAEDNVEACRKVNRDGTENIAKVCQALDIKMMYFSTDYVFDGKGTRPWEPDDPVTTPLNVYGLTKYEGEEAVRAHVKKHFILRIAWVFGKGKNFIRTMVGLGKTHDRLTVVNDQFGTPTYTVDLAVLIADMIVTEKYGNYHVTNEGGFISWYDLACETFVQAGMDVEVIPVSSAEYAAKAVRPENSRLSKDKLEACGFARLPDWKDAVGRYLKSLNKE